MPYFASYVDNTPLREKFLELLGRGESISSIAHRAGYTMPDGYADTTRIQRELGLKAEQTVSSYPTPNCNGKRYTSIRKCVRPATAERLCRALNVDPFEVGV
jgi:hypothetical protein